ncbi:White collar 1 protein [Cytospora mali]|uniref:White collar 1 protein n=1 Tax=Cytospora mali TaxID=578113 RepID=A0A194VZD9_CYTMA|nr:White collar 1 protein [Valsa mali]
MMNPWEACALEYRFSEKGKKQDIQPAQSTTTTTTTTTTTPTTTTGTTTGTPGTTDTLFYPGLYCPSGLDVMTVLLRVFARPNPEIDLGPVDSSVALVVCDLAAPDTPIVYVSDPFLELTGYRADEVVGRNCRFLQAPGGRVKPHSARKHVARKDIRGMREAIKANKEHQTEITNFKKDGRPFTNILTIIPITWGDGADFRYSVGFQCQKE